MDNYEDNHNHRTFLMGESLITAQQWDMPHFVNQIFQYIRCIMANSPTSAEIEDIKLVIALIKHGDYSNLECKKWILRSIQAQMNTMEYMINNNMKESPLIKLYDGQKIITKKYKDV